jgi:hypothetical protein
MAFSGLSQVSPTKMADPQSEVTGARREPEPAKLVQGGAT